MSKKLDFTTPYGSKIRIVLPDDARAEDYEIGIKLLEAYKESIERQPRFDGCR